MRRWLASTLLLLIAGAVLAPALLATMTPDLPPCCRAGGKHHCMVRTGGAGFSSRHDCPYAQHSLTLPAPARIPQLSLLPVVQDAHPFLIEFFPDAAPPTHRAREAERGPPPADPSE